ncbi:hypothetical protein [Bacillus infantis]|uniref:hypothetical protein n=1 Tax=Bacillus infantis TaxID=324767 RepID=UPI003CF5A211
MHKYQYKELDHAKQILTNGFTSKYIGSELKILAKFYKSQGYEAEKIKELLHTFCEKKLKGYNKAIHYKIINGAVSYGNNEKNKLIQIDSIGISETELNTIDNLDLPHEFKRVVFTMLVMNKLSKEYIIQRDGKLKSSEYYFGGHKNYRELVSLSKITFNKKKASSVKNIHDLIHLLNDKGIVEITSNGNVRLLFMYEIRENNSNTFIVDNYQYIGHYFDRIKGENNVKECEHCNVPTKLYNTQKFCKECSENIRTEKNREKALKYYHKSK